MSEELASEKAARFLAASLKTESEVRQKLQKLGCENEVIDRVIEHFKEISYINDKEYVDAYIRQEVKMKKYSIYEITNKLKIKGIDLELLEYVKNTLEEIDYEKEVVDKILDKKLNAENDESKIKAYLYRRGFRGGI